jgi:hypothetical protein
MKTTEEQHAEAIKELYPEHYELYKNRNKWELITIIKGKDDLIEFRKKINKILNKL